MSILCVTYTYCLYPVIVAFFAQRVAVSHVGDGKFEGSVSIVLAVHNEEESICRRLSELTGQLETFGGPGEVIVVSDGSTDSTAKLAADYPSRLVHVLELPKNAGKAVAVSHGSEMARGEILVFADARQRWADDTFERLLQNFVRSEVGAVSGELVLEAGSGVLSGVGLYWRYERWLRRNEGRVHSTVGVSGSICAVRRSLFRPIPAGTLLDDVYWPMRVVMQGYRVIHDDSAVAIDRLPKTTRDEFRRKVRTLSGNFQLVVRLPSVLLPWRNPIWVQFVSHKILRLVVPWALISALIASALLPGPYFAIAFFAQVIIYGLGVTGVIAGSECRWRGVSAAGAFLVLNAAAWFSFWVWIAGRSGGSWRKARYEGNRDAAKR